MGGTEMALVAFPSCCAILTKILFTLASSMIYLESITTSREVHMGISIRLEL
jgi:hypothetical protein